MTAQLPDQDLSGDDQTGLDAAQTQILCLIVPTLEGGVIDTKRHNRTKCYAKTEYSIFSKQTDQQSK
jgi:hypothetical protein